ncbi:D-2-hydroxyacid dehydrogenase [Photobacterium galatheae]|uniref:Glycerate dehydrogenase n=1 Tax=Photobacterium galatheae TaxID=1654360 RepID=A0A066RQ64_9GAMM|nr:D-2-hydroxyacid dehydrogenase [Photobacterium galatheae]KDM92509.1 glycerate dehydrogenase [Photobacterium galatheae]MCM0147986.1 D-2-hydroxyacid dehydrogenase [Photobacterium galatheae]
MQQIVFLDRDTIPSQITLPRPAFAHQWQEYPATRPAQVVERLQQATIAITNKVVLNADTLRQLPQLRMVAIAATGTNNVDLDYCREHGIVVSNIRGYATGSVPEHVIAMLFALRRSLFAYHQDIQAGVWQEKQQFCFFTHPIGDVAGSTLGIIGSGSLGQAVARLASAIGMNVIFAERKAASECREGYLPFAQVLKEADAITLHCPLSEETTDLIAAPELAQMKPGSLLINTGRGGLVNEADLVAALQSGHLGGAGCDVFTAEPAEPSNPLLAHADLPNLLLTPHVAWGADSAIQALANQLTENLEAFVAGHPRNRV